MLEVTDLLQGSKLGFANDYSNLRFKPPSRPKRHNQTDKSLSRLKANKDLRGEKMSNETRFKAIFMEDMYEVEGISKVWRGVAATMSWSEIKAKCRYL